ncbi:MAG: hypothetical protein AB8B69_07300 [Chitinophagales bacterium]
MTLSPKNLFLIDGLGALLSAFLLGVVLVHFESIFRMPQQVLYVLSAIPCLFAIYSWTCYFRTPNNWQPYLKAIAIANTLYCCLTSVLVIYYYSTLSMLGVLYFVLEILVVMTLVIVELNLATNKETK